MSRPRATSDDQILATARSCFLQHGPGVATTLIATELGISHAILFQRFGTKENLMRAALLPQGDPPWLALLRAGPDDRDARTQLLELAEQIFAFFQALVPGIMVLHSAGLHAHPLTANRNEAPPVRTRREVAAWFERAGARGLVREIDPRHAADLLLGAIWFRPFQDHIARVESTRAKNRSYVEFAVDAIWHSIRPMTRIKRASLTKSARSK